MPAGWVNERSTSLDVYGITQQLTSSLTGMDLTKQVNLWLI